jgi:hypothetical protein
VLIGFGEEEFVVMICCVDESVLFAFKFAFLSFGFQVIFHLKVVFIFGIVSGGDSRGFGLLFGEWNCIFCRCLLLLLLFFGSVKLIFFG